MTACGTCVFWDKQDDDLGYCVRYPPTVVAIYDPASSTQPEGTNLSSRWPRTLVSDGCGEYHLRVTPKDDAVPDATGHA